MTTLSLSALVVDIGVLLIGRARVSAALDSAVLAAAQDLPNTAVAQNTFDQYVATNMPTNYIYSISGTTVSFPGALNNRIQATATVNAQLGFMRVLGRDIGTVGGVAEARNADPDLALVVDRSGSMCHDSHPGSGADCPDDPPFLPLLHVQNASSQLIGNLPTDALLALVSYATLPTLDVSLTTDMVAVQASVDAIEPDGDTDIGGGIYTARDELLNNGRPYAPKVIVLITDGIANVANGSYVGSSAGTQHALTAAQNAADNSILILTIAFGGGADQTLMQDIADITEGTFYSAPNPGELQQVFDEIAGLDYVQLMP